MTEITQTPQQIPSATPIKKQAKSTSSSKSDKETKLEKRLLRTPGKTFKAEFRITKTEGIKTSRVISDPNGYYVLLGLNNPNDNLTADDIKTAFRDKAKLWHPDGTEPDAVMFDRLRVAYSVLRDEETRKQYDEMHGTAKWLDKDVLSELVKKISGKGKQDEFIKMVKESLYEESTPIPPPAPVFTDYAFYHYEGEEVPLAVERNKWFEWIKIGMWKRGLVGVEVRVGFTEGDTHLVEKPWGTVLMCGGTPSPSEAQFAVDFL